MKVRSHISQKDRKKLVLSGFLGVDFSSSPYKVAKYRATKMRNLINDSGVNHKRPGWREIKRFAPEGTKDSYSINGIFKYEREGYSAALVHAGDKIYVTTDLAAAEPELMGFECISEHLTLTDTRSEAFFYGGRLYIIGCGDYLVYGTWDSGTTYELRRVYGDVDTYVPTTSISIDNDLNTSDTVRATLDQINRLTPWRRNKLVGASLSNGEELLEGRSWTLDSAIVEGTDVTVSIEALSEGETVTLELSNTGEDKTLIYRLNSEAESTLCGSIDYAAGRITLNIDTEPPIEGSDNITVRFCASAAAEYTLGDCSFGVLFGTDGHTDRIFLAGNAKYPNVDFYSEAFDYTYFPERNYCTVGSDASAIIGYIRLSDSTLAIFKDDYLGEPNLFYRTGSTQVEYDSSGVISDVYGMFPAVSGSIGEVLISRAATANFGDDSLMLSRNGVYGIVLGTNARTTERYTRERSRSINEKLTGADLKNACAVVYRNRYYLSADGVCYVADARFTYRASDSLDGAYNYEWWYWDNIPARIFATLGDNLYFGTSDGRICVFDDEYTDRTYFPCEVGDIAYNTDLGTVAYRGSIKINEGERIVFKDPIYVAFAEGCTVKDSRISFPAEMLDEVYNGITVYAENVDGISLERNVKYTVCDVDKYDLTYRLADAEGNMLELPDTAEGAEGFSLCRNMQGKTLYVTDIGAVASSEFSLRELPGTITLRLIAGEYNAVPQPRASIVYVQNVVAEWYSPLTDLGTNDYSKTLLGITVCTEPELNGRVEFGYETRAVTRLMSSRGLNESNLFSFDNFSFVSFSFDTGFASSYTKRLNERNFNFIVFRFLSDSDTDVAVNDITVTYKINKRNIGVR